MPLINVNAGFSILKILETLMEKGLNVDNGDKLGKTIIFARNNKHAVFIKNTFDKLCNKIKMSRESDTIDLGDLWG